MSERWFDREELDELSRPTMDGAIEALDAGELDSARALCEEMKHEWLMLHDLMAESLLGLISFVQERLGDEGVAEAWTQATERAWTRHHDAIGRLDRRELVYRDEPVRLGAAPLAQGPVRVDGVRPDARGSRLVLRA